MREGPRQKSETAAQGVKLARIARLAKAYPEWSILERDVISDPASSFAILQNKKTQQCQFVAESGATPALAVHTAFVPNAKCTDVLASSRYEKNGKVFYLAMFRDQARRQLVGVVSVASGGGIVVEKDLAKNVNQTGATNDMKSAKAALAEQLD